MRHDLRDERYRAARLLGLGSIPVTVVGGILASDFLLSVPLIVACVLSGYVRRERSGDGARAGAVTVATGGLPFLLWGNWQLLVEWWRNPLFGGAGGDSWLLTAIILGVVAGQVLVLALLLLLFGRTCGSVGGRVAERLEGQQPLDSAA